MFFRNPFKPVGKKLIYWKFETPVNGASNYYTKANYKGAYTQIKYHSFKVISIVIRLLIFHILLLTSQRYSTCEHLFSSHLMEETSMLMTPIMQQKLHTEKQLWQTSVHIFFFLWISKKKRENKRFKLVTFASCGVIIIL